jgi:hypothetical protein
MALRRFLLAVRRASLCLKNLKYFEWTSPGSGHIIESLEAANANFNAQWARPRRARQDPSRVAELEQRNKASYDQIVGSYQ